MTVVEGWFSGVKYNEPPTKASLPPNVAEAIINNICLNSKAFYIEEPGKKTEFVGNRTECALLMLCERDFGVPYDGIRKQNERNVPYVRSCSLSPAYLPWLLLVLLLRSRCSRAQGDHWALPCMTWCTVCLQQLEWLCQKPRVSSTESLWLSRLPQFRDAVHVGVDMSLS